MDPQVARVLEMVQAQQGMLLPVLLSDPAAARARPRTWGADMPAGPDLELIETRTVSGPGGDIPVRVYLPHQRQGAYLHIHGGGWVLGAHDASDWWLSRIAHEASVAIVSVGYRLAPEHPYPAGLDDCVAAAHWLVKNAGDFCPRPEQIGIGGESAGANLAVATLLRLRDENGGHPFSAAALTFGVFDAGLGLRSMREWGERELILSLPIMQAFVNHYAPPGVDDPYVSPLRADLAGMPPACFVVGDLDPLLSDTEDMFEAWRAAGNSAELHRYTDAFHGFTGIPMLDLGRRATSTLIGFLRDTIAPPTAG